MKYFPLFLSLDDKPVLIVGGGQAALAKLRLLGRTGCRVTVIAPRLHCEFERERRRGAIDVVKAHFSANAVQGFALVYAATEDAGIDLEVAVAARGAGIPVNVVDRPDLCDFVTPSVVDRSPVTVAISTEGQAPMLGRKIRAAVEAMLPHGIGERAARAGRIRASVRERIPDATDRRRFWTEYFARDLTTGLDLLDRTATPRTGRVSLVGAGPGDPELLTIKAVKRLQGADVIVVDRLVHASILDHARRDAEIIYVGKAPGMHSVSQGEINALLVERASAGQDVVRLKGGDPMVFARAAEEIEALTGAGLEVDIVPGITSALGCAASVGLPLTSRDRNRGFSFLTGTATSGFAEHDWHHLARPDSGSVFYMGVRQAGSIQQRLLDAGCDPETPVVLVENGTRPDQKVAEGPLSALHEMVIDNAITGPALIYVGVSRVPLGAATGERADHLDIGEGRARGLVVDREPAPAGRQA